MTRNTPMMTAAAALAAAYSVDERCARLSGALLAAYVVIVDLQHDSDPALADILKTIEAAFRREPSIAYRGWSISYDPPPIPARNCDWAFSHPDFDASWEGEEDGWVGNGLCGTAGSLAEAMAEIDERVEAAEAPQERAA